MRIITFVFLLLISCSIKAQVIPTYETFNLKNGLNANSSAANQIFNYNDYKENTSVTLKQAATQKFDAAKQSEIALNNTISKTETAIKNSSNVFCVVRLTREKWP